MPSHATNKPVTQVIKRKTQKRIRAKTIMGIICHEIKTSHHDSEFISQR